MKSKHIWMKSKSYDFDEIKSVLCPPQAISSAQADFIHNRGFIPSDMTDLVEKAASRLACPR